MACSDFVIVAKLSSYIVCSVLTAAQGGKAPCHRGLWHRLAGAPPHSVSGSPAGIRACIRCTIMCCLALHLPKWRMLDAVPGLYTLLCIPKLLAQHQELQQITAERACLLSCSQQSADLVQVQIGISPVCVVQVHNMLLYCVICSAAVVHVTQLH